MPLSKNIRGVRLDSGDLKTLSRKVRDILDRSGLQSVRIITSGNLNEYKIQELVKAGAPIDSFGVGTEMVTSRDYPALDLTYKLVQMESKEKGVIYKCKKSPGKQTVPARKQVFRKYTKKGVVAGDTIGLFGQKTPGGTKALLRPIIRNGKLVRPLPSTEKIKKETQQKLGRLPSAFLDLEESPSFKLKYTNQISKLIK